MRQLQRNKSQFCMSIAAIVFLWWVAVTLIWPRRTEYIELKSDLVNMTDGEIISLIKTKYLTAYNPEAFTNYTPRFRQKHFMKKHFRALLSSTVANRLNHKKSGFFVECGAQDGIYLSNTVLLERNYDWTGVLIEADPVSWSILQKRNRHAWVANICLSPKSHAMEVEMAGQDGTAAMTYLPNKNVDARDLHSRRFKVQCFPLHLLMAAINRTEIDYFSLDVEGLELEILKTIPFDKIKIRLISVERHDSQRNVIVKEFMLSKGYKLVNVVDVRSDYTQDDLFELKERVKT